MPAPAPPRTLPPRGRGCRIEPSPKIAPLSRSFRPVRFPAAKSCHSWFPSKPDRKPRPPRRDGRDPKSAHPTNKRNRDIPGHRRRRAWFPGRGRSPAVCPPPRETPVPGCPHRRLKSFFRVRKSPSNADVPRRSLCVSRLLKSRSPLSIRPRSRFLRLRFQPARSVLCVVRHNNFSAGALDASQNLQHHTLLIDPAISCRRLDHRIFTTHVVSGHRNVESVSHFLDDIQIRHGRLDHNDVRAFFQITGHFAQCFPGVSRIHLVTAPVAKLRRGLRRFAKRPVEARTIFRGVRHNRHIFKIIFVQPATNGRHASIHHVR